MIKTLIISLITFFSPNCIFSSQHEKIFYPLQFEEITEQENKALLQELYSLPTYIEHIQISETNTPLLCTFLLNPINEFIKKNQLNISPQFFLVQQSTLAYPYRPFSLSAADFTQVIIGIHLLITLLELSLFQGIAFWLSHEIGHLVQNYNKKLIFSNDDFLRRNKEVDADRFACTVALKTEHDKMVSIQALCTLLVLTAMYDLLAKKQKILSPSLHRFMITMSYFIMQKIPQSYWNTIQHYEEIDKIFEITLKDIIENDPKDIIDIITKNDMFAEKFIKQLILNSSNQKLVKNISAKALCCLSHPSPKERFAMINKTPILQ